MPSNTKEYNKQYYEKNKEKIKEKRKILNKQYYEKNKEKHHEYYEQNKENMKDYQKSYYKQNREKCIKATTKCFSHRNNESRSTANNHRQLWTPEDIVVLEKMLAQGKSSKEIAERLGRTIAAVTKKIALLRKNGDSFNGNPVDI